MSTTLCDIALPALVIGSNSDPDISIFEILGLILWCAAFAMESLADSQKLKFLRNMKKAGQKNTVCNEGLWRYSRHPNYFAEWMVWNALVIASAPSWLTLQISENLFVWGLLGAGLLFASKSCTAHWFTTRALYQPNTIPYKNDLNIKSINNKPICFFQGQENDYRPSFSSILA